MSFFDAKIHCRKVGDQSRLLVIDRVEINDEVVNNIQKLGVSTSASNFEFLPPSGYWIAGSDSEVEGVWRWSDEKNSVIPTQYGAAGFHKWYKHGGLREPRNVDGSEDCMYISDFGNPHRGRPLLGYWISSNCLIGKNFICQANVPSKYKNSLSLKFSY